MSRNIRARGLATHTISPDNVGFLMCSSGAARTATRRKGGEGGGREGEREGE